MPVRDVLVCDTWGDIKHNDTALPVNVVTITETSELLLSSCVPNIELNVTQVLHLSVYVFRFEPEWKFSSHTVVKPRGWTSTPRVAIYFFSNSPVKWRLTKVVCLMISLYLWMDCCPLAVGMKRIIVSWQPSRWQQQQFHPQIAYLSSSSITDKHKLESWCSLSTSFRHGCWM